MTRTSNHAMTVAATLALMVGGAGLTLGAEDTDVTFSRDVAPILYENCVACHREGDIAPMALLSYEEARPWAKSIQKAVVRDRTMPPWHSIDPSGTFANDRRLSEKEIATIDTWIQAGAPEGDPADLPDAPMFEAEWRLGEPDYILTFDELSVPAEGPDQFANLVGVADFGEDKWIRAVEILPSNRKLVHHVIAITMENLQSSADGGGVQGWIAGWAAGTDPAVMPRGTARFIKQGAQIVANMHYHPYGEAGVDQTRVGFHFADPAEVRREVTNHWVMKNDFAIPAGEPAHEVTESYTFDREVDLLSVMPHMHLRGKDMKMTLAYPDGSSEVLIDVPHYDFNWQTIYELLEPKRLPEGTRLDIVGHFDNSPDNPDNPDPSKLVVFGNESTDEMFIGILDIAEVPDSEASGGGR